MTRRAGFLTRFFAFLFNLSPKKELDRYPYKLRDDFLSNAELSFYHVLRTALDGEGVICPKVSLAELFFVTEKEQYQSYFNKIDRKRVDFVVCEAKTMKPWYAVELDDRSHQREDRRERDRFVENLFAQAGVRLLRVPVRASYTVPEVKGWLQTARIDAEAAAAAPRTVEFTAENIPLCPKCGVPMIKRTAQNGPNAGKSFYGCVNYPRCKEIQPIS